MEKIHALIILTFGSIVFGMGVALMAIAVKMILRSEP